MKIPKTQPLVLFTMLALAGIVAGCGPSKAKREAQERERQRLANKVITDMNQRAFSRPKPKMDLGVAQPEATPAPKPPSAPPPVSPASPPADAASATATKPADAAAPKPPAK
jgi:hypothetical protein